MSDLVHHGAGVRILVVDDNDTWRTALRISLEREGFQVFEESRGDRAFAALELHRPDVIVLDNHMPGLEGLDLLGLLRHRCPHLPVVLMSGDPRTAELARARGAARFIDKPFRPQELIDELRRLAARRQI